jgi:hypothetical protein
VTPVGDSWNVDSHHRSELRRTQPRDTTHAGLRRATVHLVAAYEGLEGVLTLDGLDEESLIEPVARSILTALVLLDDLCVSMPDAPDHAAANEWLIADTP